MDTVTVLVLLVCFIAVGFVMGMSRRGVYYYKVGVKAEQDKFNETMADGKLAERRLNETMCRLNAATTRAMAEEVPNWQSIATPKTETCVVEDSSTWHSDSFIDRNDNTMHFSTTLLLSSVGDTVIMVGDVNTRWTIIKRDYTDMFMVIVPLDHIAEQMVIYVKGYEPCN